MLPIRDRQAVNCLRIRVVVWDIANPNIPSTSNGFGIAIDQSYPACAIDVGASWMVRHEVCYSARV
jgi:hypothetical protein